MHVSESPRHREIRESQHDELSWRVFGALHRVMHAQRRVMTQIMADRDIQPAQAFCMRVLGHHDGVTQRDLAELLEVSRPTVTVMLQKMEKAGLVERRVDTDDQRYTRIYLTEDGWKAHEEMHGGPRSVHLNGHRLACRGRPARARATPRPAERQPQRLERALQRGDR